MKYFKKKISTVYQKNITKILKKTHSFYKTKKSENAHALYSILSKVSLRGIRLESYTLRVIKRLFMAIKQYKVDFVIKENGSSMGPHRQEIFSLEGNNYSRYLEELYGDVHIFSATEIKNMTTTINNEYNSYSNNEKSDTTLIKLGIFGAILATLWILLSNLINIGLISNYDFKLYLSNITHFNTGFGKKVTSISTTIDLTYPDKYIGKKYKISNNKIVFYNGYKDSETDRQTALSLYDKDIKVYGYIQHSKNINPLKDINPKIIAKINATINSRYKKSLESKVKLYKAKTETEIKDYKNKNYQEIPQLSNKKITYFYSKEDTNLVEDIESKYYADDVYQKEFTRLGNKYYKNVK